MKTRSKIQNVFKTGRDAVLRRPVIAARRPYHCLTIALVLLALSTLNPQLSTVHAQGTAFTYQGQLQNNSSPASGSYNLTFTLFTNSVGGTAVAGPVTNSAIVVTNGLFTVLIDFGAGVFTGATNWLQIGVESNGTASFTTLAPRQELTPVPYAIYAESVPAAGISGTLLDTQLLHDAVTVTAGPGFSGGGKVTLGNSITLTNTGVLSVTGNADITATTVNGAVTLGDTATSADTANTLVKRDGSGNFSAATITLDGNLNLPATTATAGIIYSGGTPLIHAYGSQNFFAGPNAGNLTMSGPDNTASGYEALYNNTRGSANTAVGAGALLSNTNGSDNTAVGAGALNLNTSGGGNTANGQVALYNNTSGSDNTANGWAALYYNTSGSDNTANGVQALNFNTSGSDNTANGYQALYSNTNGVNNTANGYQALYSNRGGDVFDLGDGSYNTANGEQALYSNTKGFANVADGEGALIDNTNGSYNTASGTEALYSNTSGNRNTANGAYALYENIGGSYNIALGFQAGSSLNTGSYNIEIGNGGGASDNQTIRIGDSQTATFIAGISGATAASGVVVYVNTSGQLGTLTSSRRFKDDIRGMDQASAVLYALKPVTFKYKPGIDPQAIPQFGLVAEDVEKVAPDLVARDDQGKIYTVRYQAVDAMLLNEFLKEHRTVEEQNATIETLKQRLDKLERLIAQKTGGQL